MGKMDMVLRTGWAPLAMAVALSCSHPAGASAQAPNPLITRDATLATETGPLMAKIPNFLPPEALPPTSVVHLVQGPVTVGSLSQHNRLHSTSLRQRMYEEILRNLWFRAEVEGWDALQQRVDELGRTGRLTGSAATLSSFANELAQVAGGAASQLPSALTAVSLIIDANQRLTESEMRALITYAAVRSHAEVRIETFDHLLQASTFQDEALVQAVGTVHREYLRDRDADFETIRRIFAQQALGGVAGDRVPQLLGSSLIGHATAAVLGAGAVGMGTAVLLPATLFFSLDRMGNRLETEAVLTLGATMVHELFEHEVERWPISQRIPYLEMRDQLWVTLKDAATAYGGREIPPRRTGLIDPNSRSAETPLTGRDYRRLAQQFAAAVHVPDPRLASLYQRADNTRPLEPPRSGSGILLVIDLSGSMDGSPLEEVRTGVLDLMREMPPTTPVGVLTFGAQCRVDLAVPFTTDHERVVDLASAMRASGSTPLAAAIDRARELTGSADAPAEVHVILHSDGGETCSGDPVAAANRLGALLDGR